jgi:quercetin dioxygenase-like cupin family protein
VKRHNHVLATAAVAVTLVTAATLVGVTMASPASGVTPTLLARGAYEEFKVKSVPDSPVDFQVKAKSPVDVVVRKHDYAVGSHTGWHSHPGPVFITVTQGTLTYYLYDDPDCTPHVVHAGEGFVDDARGHIVRNESSQPAQDVSVILAPTGGAFRGELNAPNPYCGF